MIPDYGVLKGKVVDMLPGRTPAANADHFQIYLDANGSVYRVAVNVLSQDKSEVMFFLKDNYTHNFLDQLLSHDLPLGATHIGSNKGPQSLGLDFIRRNLLDFNDMIPLPISTPGNDNDLNDLIGTYVKQALNNDNIDVYAFGDLWKPTSARDKYINKYPDQGIHDIHMNQGNSKSNHGGDNGTYQDGGILFFDKQLKKWVVMLMAFKTQFSHLNPNIIHTDDATGNPISGDATQPIPSDGGTGPIVNPPATPNGESDIQIIASLVNPSGSDPGLEIVYLLNISNTDVNLSGWKIADKLKKTDTISNQVIKPGEVIKIHLSGNGAQLSNEGGIITLLNKNGLKIDGVSYTKENTKKEGWLVTF